MSIVSPDRYKKMKIIFEKDLSYINIKDILVFISKKYIIGYSVHLLQNGTSSIYVQSEKKMVSSTIEKLLRGNFGIKNVTRFYKLPDPGETILEQYGEFRKNGRYVLPIYGVRYLKINEFGDENLSHISHKMIQIVLENLVTDVEDKMKRASEITVDICNLLWCNPSNMNVLISNCNKRIRIAKNGKWIMISNDTLTSEIYENVRKSITILKEKIVLTPDEINILDGIYLEGSYNQCIEEKIFQDLKESLIELIEEYKVKFDNIGSNIVKTLVGPCNIENPKWNC